MLIRFSDKLPVALTASRDDILMYAKTNGLMDVLCDNNEPKPNACELLLSIIREETKNGIGD